MDYWVIGVLLLALELYHFISHIYVLFGIRMLPRKGSASTFDEQQEKWAVQERSESVLKYFSGSRI